MKFNTKCIYFIITVLVSAILFSVTLQTETTAQAKKEVSMMEFMNSFYSSDKKAEAVLASTHKEAEVKTEKVHKEHKEKKHSKKKLHSRKGHKSFRFKQDAPKENCTAGETELYRQILRLNNTISNNTEYPNPNHTDIIIEGELFVSSTVFWNKERYPSIMLQNGTEQEIKVDEEFFRINQNECEETTCKLNFFFRLGVNQILYYSSSEKDLNVLGSIQLSNIKQVGDPLSPILSSCGETFCFEIQDDIASNWKLCAATWKRSKKWSCVLKKLKGKNDPSCDGNLPDNIEVVEKIIKEPIIVIPLPSRHCNDAWNYQKGGDDWECECSEGKEQSPIDIPPQNLCVESNLKPLFTYHEVDPRAPFDTVDKELIKDEALKIKIFEGAIRIFHHSFGKIITLDGAVYNAQEIVFHSPSEHTIEGKKYDMEVQIVHYGQTVGDISKQVIFSFLIEKKPGVYNKFFDDLDIFNLPDALNKQKDIANSLYIPKLLYKSDEDATPMMKPFSFYTYQGSLTAPPCNERTIVYVASKPIPLSSTTITLFQEALRIPDLVDQKGNVIVTDWVPQSSRNIQPLNGRPVFYYDHEKYCGHDPVVEKPKPKGHYEKIIKKATHYFYVNGNNASGLPGAFVVSEPEAKGDNADALQA